MYKQILNDALEKRHGSGGLLEAVVILRFYSFLDGNVFQSSLSRYEGL